MRAHLIFKDGQVSFVSANQFALSIYQLKVICGADQNIGESFESWEVSGGHYDEAFLLFVQVEVESMYI